MARQMKDSGVEWIGQIPEEWHVSKIKNVYIVILGKMLSPSQTQKDQTLENYLCAANIKWSGVDTSIQKQMWFSESDKAEYKLHEGDILIMEGGLAGTSCKYRGEMAPCFIQNSVHCCRAKSNYSNQFLYYWMNVVYNSKYIENICNKATIQHYTKEKVMNTPFLICSSLEQEKIVSYLDRKCAQIDAIISKQQQIIEKLKEYKLSVITEAVTKGLDPNVPMKDSGVEWIGMVPERWKVGQLKYFATIRAGLTLGKKYEIDAKLVEMPYLRVANVQGEYVDLSDVSSVSVLPEEVEKYSLHKNELLMTEGGDKDKLGRGCVWNGEIDPCLHQNHVFAVATDAKKLSIHFLSYLTTSGVARSYFEYTAKKTTNLASTNSTIILQFKLPIPSIQEQGDIICYLDKCCKQINTLIHEKENILSKINEYKKALIYEVVTGKKEVL